MKIEYNSNEYAINIEDVHFGTFIMYDDLIMRVGKIISMQTLNKVDKCVAVVMQHDGSIKTLPFRTEVKVLPEPTLVFPK
ncbi:hypothetical protein MM5_079 [Morganella phage vB_Mm5]